MKEFTAIDFETVNNERCSVYSIELVIHAHAKIIEVCAWIAKYYKCVIITECLSFFQYCLYHTPVIQLH